MIEIQMYANVHDVKRMELNSLQPRKIIFKFSFFYYAKFNVALQGDTQMTKP